MRSHERCSVECRLAEIVVGGCAGGVEGLGVLGADWCLGQGGVKARFLHLSEGVGFGLSGFVLRQLQCGLGVGQLLRLGFRALAVGVGAVHEMTEQQTEQQLHSGGDENELQPREGAVVAEHIQKQAGAGGEE